MGGGGNPGIIPVLQGGDTGGIDVQVRIMVNFRHDNECGGGNPRGFPPSDHGEEVDVSGIKGMGDTNGREITTGEGEAVGGQLHSP